jgi:cytochrome P450
MTGTERKHYTVSGPRGLPGLGVAFGAYNNPLQLLNDNAINYGDIVPFHVLGQKVIQINHPDLVRYVLMENHKNYQKNRGYIRFESVLGKGLLTSNGEKWRRDRQRIQPMFKRELIETYYFNVVNEVSEKYKQRWLKLTEHGKAEINITWEMAAITLEIIVRLIFGKDNLSEEQVNSLHHSYEIFLRYLAKNRFIPEIDLRKVFLTPQYIEFNREVKKVYALVSSLIEKNRANLLSDKYNMLALLVEAQKQDPENFSDQDIREHTVSMVFAGFETTSILMQWIWYALDQRPDIANKLRTEITTKAPCTATADSSSLTYEAVGHMDYLTMVFKESMRLYPPLWAVGRAPVNDDWLGDFKIKRGVMVLIPLLIMHRHPNYWDEPNAFIPERFLPENEAKIDEGLYFPFSQGARKCSGYRLAEMEAKVIFTKLLPLFKVKAVNILGNDFDPSISLKIKQPLKVQISRI